VQNINLSIKEAADAHIELIPPPFDELYRAMGYKNFVLLFDYFGGQNVYVPTLRTIFSDAIKARIRQEIGESTLSMPDIAKKYGYTSQYLRRAMSL